MALKTWSEMKSIDVAPFCKKRDGMDYLNWAKCIELLHEHGAEEVRFEPVPMPNGSSLIMSDKVFTDKNGVANQCYETRIKVTIDGKEYFMQTPVMNGSNPVKDNSMSQIRVWNSMCRAFVKCVAINTGLGFDLWVKEENKADLNIPDTLQKRASSAKIKTLQNLCMSHGLDGDKWVASNNRTWETLTEEEAAKMLVAIKERYGDE